MSRFLYVSPVVPGKTKEVRYHYQKEENEEERDAFWKQLGMTDFDCWLQHHHGLDYLVHCLEGESLERIFRGLRNEIARGNPIAKKLHAYYLNVLGKDYSSPKVIPDIELVFDMEFPIEEGKECYQRGFMFPLLPDQVHAHKEHCQLMMDGERSVIQDSCTTFGLARMTKWIQRTLVCYYIVVYQETTFHPAETPKRDGLMTASNSYQTISKSLMSHTGLSYENLSPNMEWLKSPILTDRCYL